MASGVGVFTGDLWLRYQGDSRRCQETISAGFRGEKPGWELVAALSALARRVLSTLVYRRMGELAINLLQQ